MEFMDIQLPKPVCASALSLLLKRDKRALLFLLCCTFPHEVSDRIERFDRNQFSFAQCQGQPPLTSELQDIEKKIEGYIGELKEN